MLLVYIAVIGVAAFIIWNTIWATSKAYSKKWDRPDE